MPRHRRSRRLFGSLLAVVAALSVAVAPVAVAGPAAVPTPAPTPAPALPPGGSFVPVAPMRVLDTRAGGGPATVVAVDPRAAFLGVATSEVAAVLLNVTVVDARSPGYVLVGNVTGTSNGNYVALAPSATMALVPYAAPSVRVSLSTPADVVVDVQGYVTTPAAATSASFTPLDTPRRIADSRSATGLRPFTQGQTQTLDARALASLPVDATAVIVNVTVASASASTYVTGWSGSGTRPTVSTVNAGAGDIVANRALIPLDRDGRLGLFNSAGRTDLVVDVVGYLSPDANGSYYTPLPPSRVVDDPGTSGSTVLLSVGTNAAVRVPAGDDLAPTTAVWLTLIGDHPIAAGFIVAGARAGAGTSDLNEVPGRAVANAGPVRVAEPDGTIDVESSVPGRLVVDFDGWFRQAAGQTKSNELWSSARTFFGTDASYRQDTVPGRLPAYFGRGVFPGLVGSDTKAYAVDATGMVDTAGYLDDQGGVPSTAAVHPVNALSGIAALATSGEQPDAPVYALTRTGRLYGFGSNEVGQLGQVPSADPNPFPVIPVPEQIPLPGPAAAVYAVPGVGYAVLSDGTTVSWGWTERSQLGRDAGSTPWVPAPVAFPDGPPTAIAGDDTVSFAVDAAGRTTWWGSPLPASGSRTRTVQDIPALFPNGCPVAKSLHADADGVWELCADGTVVQLDDEGRLFTTRRTLAIAGVTAIGAGAGYRSGIRVVLSDGRVADVPTDGDSRYEAGFIGVTAVNGSRSGVQVTLVGS